MNIVTTVRDGEGRKINGYKIRTDAKGIYINRFGMRASLDLETEVKSTSGCILHRFYKVGYYE